MNKNKINTGILIHGCNLGAFQWQRIVWGEPPLQLGRITRALLVLLEETSALRSGIAVLVMGTNVVWTGGGKKSKHSGHSEAEATRQLMFEKLPQLKEFSIFKSRFPEVEDESFIEQLRQHLDTVTKLATECENTAEEIQNAAHIFRKHYVNRAILVSSPVHLPRCIKEATIVFAENNWRSMSYGLFAAPSDTNYQDTTPSDVAIFEPPHRPDRPMYPIQQFVSRIAQVSHKKMEFFLRDLDELLEEYGA
jgi:hypothetical protein